ncbi:MAG TPA: ABC transporter permease, partial [Saprospiraceae bacterium]|nr:ABC transporter permease [Saprospiraceae bacterium]
KYALRDLVKNRFFSALNILGLAAALTCSAFIALWIWDEWRRDRFFPNADRIVRLTGKVFTETEVFEHAVSSVPTGPAIKNEYPEVEDFVRFDAHDAVVKVGDRQFAEAHLLTVDSSFFSVFNYSLAQGDTRNALSEPYTVVLTEKLARKYFGTQDPIGQTLDILQYDTSGRGATYRVTGVLAGAPRSSHFTFDMLISFSSFLKYEPDLMTEDGWGDNSYYTYLLLKPGATVGALQAKMPGFYQKYVEPLYRKYGATGHVEYNLQPLTDIYLHSDRRYEIGPTGNAANLYIFGTVGLLILLVAGINYVNMATARASKYAKSVGVRKALGAQRGQLARQFLVESVLTALFAVSLTLAFSVLCQPVFEQMTDKPLGIFDVPALLLLLVLAALLLGLLAGVYPALVLSGFRPVAVLKGDAAASADAAGKVGLRKVLVVTQFAISMALIVSVLVIRGQMDFIRTKNLGYNKDALLILKINGDQSVIRGLEAFRNDVAANPTLIQGIAFADKLPVGGTGNNGASTVDNTGKKIQSSTYRYRIDYNYADVFGLKFLAGRNFSRQFPADAPSDSTQNYILNEAAVKAFGWETPEQAIGKPFRMSGRSGQVVGIVQDFHFNSLKHKVEPLAMHLTTTRFAQIALRIDMDHAQQAIAEIGAKWKKHFPDAYFEYAFLDEKLDTQYRSELRFGSLFGVFSVFSIFIACLGLFGLAAYTAERRTKEIGIRKVLGASVTGITGLLAKDFLKPVIVAIFIASPIAYFFMQKWLADFAYRIEIQWWIFLVAGAGAVAVAFLTVGFQSVKAALANPARSLKSE